MKPQKKRAFSLVIAAVLLSSIVLVVGGVVWSFSHGAMSVISDDYISGVNTLVEELSERFIIEHVAHNSTHLRVWIYNYGEVELTVDVYVDIDGGASGSDLDIELGSKDFIEVGIELVVSSGDMVSVKAVSRRGNHERYQYLAT